MAARRAISTYYKGRIWRSTGEAAYRRLIVEQQIHWSAILDFPRRTLVSSSSEVSTLRDRTNFPSPTTSGATVFRLTLGAITTTGSFHI